MANALTGGRVNYYKAEVCFPQREDQAPYTAECEDIIEVLELNPDEANIFKEIWRSANARKGNGKPGHTAIYGAEKIHHYAERILRRARRNQVNETPDPIVTSYENAPYAQFKAESRAFENAETLSAGRIARSVGASFLRSSTDGDDA
jgi:hypothetical protein